MIASPIAHVLPSIARAQGGPSVSVRRLIESLDSCAPDIEWKVVAGDLINTGTETSEWNRISPELFGDIGPRRLGWSPRLRAALVRHRPRLIHLHGLWRYHAWAASRTAEEQRVPLVISPRGMLEPWALRQGRLQKWVANHLFQKRMFRRAACVVATSELEAKSVRDTGVSVPLAIIPNGIDLPPAFGRAYSGPLTRPRIALFLSRIHSKKGILDLVRAWKRVSPVGWRLRIVGPSEGGYADVVKSVVVQESVVDSVEVGDAVWGEDKHRTMAAAQLFVLPSYSENFGLAIGEAMAAGLPVITTRATPWSELESAKCGWWMDVGLEPLVAALHEATQCAPGVLAEMGNRGTQLIARRYAWASVARSMLEVYQRAAARSH